MTFLYAAYAASWIIHIVYLSIVMQKYRRLRNEIEALKKK
jgi:hypothetical protein